MAAPYEDEAVSFVAGVNNPGDYWVSVAARRLETCTTTRGRQYELDTVQTGEYHPTWDNRDGNLTPGSTASVFYPNVVPNRPVRKRMQYPATVNMLTPNQASSGQAPLVAGIDGPVAAGSPVDRVFGFYQNPLVTTSGTAFEGTQVLQTTVPASPSTGAALIFMTGFSVAPSQAHTFSVYVRTPTGSVALQAKAAITWIDTSGNVISQSLGTPATLPVASTTWTRITVTATPPSNTAGAWAGVTGANSPSAGFTLQCDGAQLEYAAAATAYTQPGTWYHLFYGFIERWPQKWDHNGLFHKTVPVAVDHFGYLSQQLLKPPLYSTVLSYNPRYFYTFDVGKTAGYVNDLSHNRGPAQVVNSWYGAGSLTFGNQITSIQAPTFGFPVGGNFLGGAANVASFANTTSNVTNPRLAGTYIDLTTASNYTGPVGDGTGWYTRVVGFKADVSIPAWYMALWSMTNPSFNNSFNGDVSLLIDNTETMSVSGVASFPSNWGGGIWAMAAFRVNTTTNQIATWINGFEGSTATSPNPLKAAPGCSDAVGMQIYPGTQNAGRGYKGDMAWVAEFPGYLSGATLTDIYNAMFGAYIAVDTSANRYSRILGWAGYSGKSRITTTPGTVDMGPASDITQGGQQATIYAPVTGTDVQTALQNVVTTENGNHFVAGDGTLTFQSRSSRYGVTTPSIVFGDGAGEISYEDVEFDFDLTRVGNDVQVTQFENSAVFEAFAPASQTNNGTRTLTRTINSDNPLECNDCASYLAYKYGNPDLRMKTLRIHVTANPTQWGTLLGLECGVKARVMRRSLEQTIQWDGFVEKIGWSIDYTSNDVYLDLEMSPADLSAFWLLSAWHTTLASSYTAGALNSNSTFESGLTPWTASGTSSFTQSSTQKHTGSFSAKLVPDGTTANVGPSSEQVAVTANGAVTVSCWVWFTNAVTTQFSASVNWYNSSHTYLTTTSTFVSASAATWTNVTNTFQAPAGAAYAAFVPVLIGTPAAAQIWYVDDATIQSAAVVLNPIGASSTLPVAAYVTNNLAGASSTVQVASYSAGGTTYPAPKIRLGAGTGTFEEIAVTSYTCTGGTAVTNYAGATVPGQFTGYTSVTVTLASAPANSYSAGATVSEALPAGMTDPTAHDADAVIGTTTIIGY